MADGILGLGSSMLNQDLIDELKAAERKAQVDPIEARLEALTGVDAETGEVLETAGEEARILLIEAKAIDLMNKISSFDLYSTDTNAFEQVSASTTGNAAVFDAVDIGGLTPGTNYVTINQLAQRDVYQTSTFTETQKDQQIIGGNDSGDMFVISQTGRPVYQSDSTSTETSTDLVGEGTITITPAGGSDITITTTATTTWDDLKTLIDNETDLNASFVNNRLSVTSADGKTALTITDTDGTVATDLGLTLGEKFTTVGKTYEELATSINSNPNYTAAVELVGTDSYRIVLKSTESGTANALNITQIGVDLGLGGSQSSTDTVADTSAKILGAGQSATMVINGNTISIDDTTTYDDLKVQIDALDNITATVSNGNTFDISTDDGSVLSITESGVSFGFTSNHVLTAQNLKANVDGVDYDVSSNVLTIQGNLTMTAVEVGNSTISIQRDTTSVLTGFQDFLTAYNELVDAVDEELLSADSPIQDTSSLRMMMSTIKDMIFGSYGTNNDENLFNYGLELDKSGHLTVDSTIFAEALTDKFDNMKSLFLGVAENEGFGTVMKKYLDGLDSYDGLMTAYDNSMASRKETLEEEREKAIEDLDAKYALLAEQFSAYGVIISQMEASFGGLKMMIDQSVASK